MSTRQCATCNRVLDRHSYSNNQWRKSVGVSRCHSCINGGGAPATGSDGVDASQTARRNNAQEATFQTYDLDHPFAEGGFRWVAKGQYVKGGRSGQACVCKWFKSGAVFEATFFDKDIEAMNKALEIIQQWNRTKQINKLIQINIPEVWTFKNTSGGGWAGRKCLQEPFIQNYQKFNSNTGWADDSTPWPRVMQALSHYSYHASGGNVVLCDLQGGVYATSVVLTDPVILSRNKAYGVTDLGPQGISTFFSNHRCNEFCKGNWSKPTDQRQYFRPQEGTSMMRPKAVPTRASRPMNTFYEDDSDEDLYFKLDACSYAEYGHGLDY
ncbi:Alpha-protein kinase [Seminavis robusta]|uniref:Alpha-protein kinase n=1 Tax=Seminavis robusta TaxID=568900 RepID=A0A9N8DUF3_9STRA|nr:Alpha-protein kinase [Seminavis robusta]|eukprot:Sro379_g130490.1 Alpha-protein kinase (325) ;mRNA; r:46102-47076